MTTSHLPQDAVIEQASRVSRRGAPGGPSWAWMWLALVLLAVGWLGVVPVFTAPHWSAASFFVLASLFGAIAFRRCELSPLPTRYLGLLLPLGGFIIFMPWPYSLGPALLAVSLVALSVGRHNPKVLRGAVALGVCGLVTLLEAIIQPVLWKLLACAHGVAWAAEFVGLILRMVGARVSVDGSVLHVQTFDELAPVNVTWEALGGYVLALVLLSGAAFLFAVRAGVRRWLTFSLLLFLYPLLRYPVLFFAYQESGRSDLFWAPWTTVLTFLPLAALLGRFVTDGLPTPEQVRWPPLPYTRKAFGLLLLSTVVATSVIGLFSFQDPGVRKHGRILIDEAHSNWEWTTRKYDTEWYSQASGYNYYCLADYLGYFYAIDRGTKQLTPEVLRRYDVLILKTLTKPLQPKEIDTVAAFVRAGGGLWLVGDHTNVFGISEHMNPLAQRFGLSYKHDATYDLVSGGLSIYRPSVLLPHPTVQHMPPVFLFGTSCSMNAGLLAGYPIIGYGLKGLRADYARESFFPENKLTLDQEFGLLLQQAALPYGRGRVAAFTDSTVFSNFWFFMPGKSELCLGTINWLNRSNRWGAIRWLFGGIILGALWLMPRWSRGRERRAAMIWIAAGLLVGVPLGCRAFAAMNRAAYPLPSPRRALPQIAFEREHCNFTLPSESLDQSMALENHYHTFFVWTQRLGYMPISTASLEAALTKKRLTVLVNPARDFAQEDRLLIRRYLQGGGRLLVMDGAHNAETTANQFLEEYGLRIEDTSVQQSFVFDRTGRRIASVAQPRSVKGGQPLLKTAFGKPFLAATQVGKGALAVMGNSELFTDRHMGVTSAVPDVTQRGIYEMEFWLFRNLMEGPSDPVRWEVPRSVWDTVPPDATTTPVNASAGAR